MKREDFDALLLEAMEADGAGNILVIPGVYEAVSEHYNNAILETYKSRRENRRRANLPAKMRAYHDRYFVNGRKI